WGYPYYSSCFYGSKFNNCARPFCNTAHVGLGAANTAFHGHTVGAANVTVNRTSIGSGTLNFGTRTSAAFNSAMGTRIISTPASVASAGMARPSFSGGVGGGGARVAMGGGGGGGGHGGGGHR